MKSIKNVFNPFFSLFTIDYSKRLLNSTELTLYEAKRRYIDTAQMKQHYDAELAFQANRVNMLSEMVSIQKGIPHAKINSITDVAIISPVPESGR